MDLALPVTLVFGETRARLPVLLNVRYHTDEKTWTQPLSTVVFREPGGTGQCDDTFSQQAAIAPLGQVLH